MKSRRTVKKKNEKNFSPRCNGRESYENRVCSVGQMPCILDWKCVKSGKLNYIQFQPFFCNENLCKFTQMHNLHAYRGSHTRMMSTRKTPTVFMRRVNIFLICQYVFAIIVQIFGVLFSFGWFVILRGSTGSSSIHQELNKSKIKRQKSYTKLQSIW